MLKISQSFANISIRLKSFTTFGIKSFLIFGKTLNNGINPLRLV